MQEGDLVPFADARIHPLSLSVAYATTIFEGVRAYHNRQTGEHALFRVKEHLARLRGGMKLMRFDRTFEPGFLEDALVRLIRANEPDDDVYVRLLVYIGGIGPMTNTGPVNFTAAAIPREKPKYAEKGMSLCVSSWTRLNDNSSPPRIKTTANYHNSRLALLQAKADGYDGAIMLTSQGKVSETPIACIFFVMNGKLITPHSSSDILESITRDSVIQLYKEMTGVNVVEREIDRSEIYLAEEVFICGTGQEIIPVVSIDRLLVGTGNVGPVTSLLRKRYFDVARGNTKDFPSWRTPLL